MGDTKSQVIGYQKARNLMRQLDWKMLVTFVCGGVEAVELYHPNQPTRYKVRIDSGHKLIAECRPIGKYGECKLVFGYNWEGTNGMNA